MAANRRNRRQSHEELGTADEEMIRWSSGPYIHVMEGDRDPTVAAERFNRWVAQSFWDHYGSSFVEIDRDWETHRLNRSAATVGSVSPSIT